LQQQNSIWSFVGAGQRHLRILHDLLPNAELLAYRKLKKTPLLNSNFTVDHGTSLENKYNLTLFDSLDKAFEEEPDLIVISTPSSLHMDTMIEAAKRGINVFVEKPVSHNLDNFDEFRSLVKEKNLAFFVSLQRRFHPLIKKAKNIIDSGSLGKIISAKFDVASYVPFWHKYEDFHELYACKKELGGGVLLTEIHEIDLCCWFFGIPKNLFCAGGQCGEYSLDVEDTAHITLDYLEFPVQISLCFMQQHNKREFMVSGTKGYLQWNQDNEVLTHYVYDSGQNNKESVDDFTNDMMFYEQANYFINDFNNNDKSYLDIAYYSQLIVEAAKKSIASGLSVKL
jgi:predicted dehydrogenase